MTVDLTASKDACQPSADVDHDDGIIWLEPQSTRPGSPTNLPRKAFVRITTSISLGACLTLGTATAATAPVVTIPTGGEGTAAVEPAIQLPAPAAIDLSDVVTHQARTETQVATIEPAQTSLARGTGSANGYDPLEAIIPPEPAKIEDLQAQIILSGREQNPDGIPDVPIDAERAALATIDWIQFDGQKVPRWIVDTILRASATTGVDPVYMMALADKESSFLPDSEAESSSAVGLFQFLAGTWLEMIHDFGARHGLTAEAEAVQETNGDFTVADEAMRDHILDLRKNPYVAALMAAEMMKRDRAAIERRIGRTISRSEFYFAHFFGVNSATKFIRLVDGKPKQSAPRVFPAAAKANRSLFFAKAGRKMRQLTIAEVYDKIDDMIDTRLDRYEGVADLIIDTADLSL